MSKIDNQKIKQVSKNFLFSRTAVVIVLLAFQMFIFWQIFIHVGGNIFWTPVTYIFYAASAVLVVYMFNRNVNPSFRMTWMLILLLVPVFGAFFYIFVQTNVGARKLYKRVCRVLEETKDFLPMNQEMLEHLQKEEPDLARLARYLSNSGGFTIQQNNEVKYLPVGEDFFAHLKDQLAQAQKFIFMEYFLIDQGYMWSSLLEILEKKVQEGVEVRLIFDGLGCTFLPHDYDKQLREKGIKARVFNKVRPFLSTQYNNRDHRKITIIDGKTAFTGGINLADEYINRVKRFGHWKDNAVMISGSAVANFTLLFLRMWSIAGDEKEDYRRYLDSPTEKFADPGQVLVYGDNPMDHNPVGESVYLDIIYKAQKYVYMTTPYLVIGNELILAMSTAAKSGIDVRLVVPHIPDKKWLFWVTQSFYPVLLEAGVKIYEYTPGFIHAKTFVSDDQKAVVGSINLDFRSLYLHFECAAYLHKVPAVKEVITDIKEIMAKSQPVTMDDYKRSNPFSRLLGKILRIFSPLM
ncbi:MAG: cardiolipin synthase [Bacillota bacterium]